MKVVFINNKFENKVHDSYTLDKVYEAKQSPIMANMYLILDDSGKKSNIAKYRFITLAEYRQQQLIELLNETDI